MPALTAAGAPDPTSGGDFYCDANQVQGVWCTEVDLMEANVAALQATPHACNASAPSGFVPVCDRGGCGANTRAQQGALGPGPAFAINTQLPFTVSTSFPAPGGALAAMTTTAAQGGRAVLLSHTDASCGAGYLERVSAGLGAGMVPTLSLWGDEGSGGDMGWLDSPPCPASQGCAGGALSVTYSALSVTDL